MQIENEIVNYLRVTSALEIAKANSGHPGICLGGAPIAYAIYKNANILPSCPKHINRDRIVFSAGHASALYYACLNLFGYDVSVQDLKNFRQFGSKTAGHPEVKLIDGVDASTGPLGQGVGMAVGMALAESYLNNHFKNNNYSPVDHYTYCFVGDGCLMEGVAQESISLAGNLKLNKLIVLFDSNSITIEGATSISNGEVVQAKFEACHWNVLSVEDGNSIASIDKAIKQAKKSDKPTLIIVKTEIGYGSEFAGKNSIHGRPLTYEQITTLRKNLHYNIPDFELSTQAKNYISKLLQQKENLFDCYEKSYKTYCTSNKKLAKEFKSYLLKEPIDLSICYKEEKEQYVDFRKQGHELVNILAKIMPNMIGGCADLAPSTKAFVNTSSYFSSKDRLGRNIAYGIREHAMGAISNGIALHGGLEAYCSTFFSFENYMTPAMRLSSMMDNHVLYYFTHDTIAVGEDGPTHQPVEQLSTLRSMPNMLVARPCGVNEMYAMMQFYFNQDGPMSFVLPRQKVAYVEDNFKKALSGGYILHDEPNFDLTLVGCGSEVSLILQTAKLLQNKGIKAKVVSMPCTQIFDKKPKSYKNKVLDRSKPIFCIEASSDNIWYKYATGPENVFLMHDFGVSGEYHEVLKHFGYTPQQFARFVEKRLR